MKQAKNPSVTIDEEIKDMFKSLVSRQFEAPHVLREDLMGEAPYDEGEQDWVNAEFENPVSPEMREIFGE